MYGTDLRPDLRHLQSEHTTLVQPAGLERHYSRCVDGAHKGPWTRPSGWWF